MRATNFSLIVNVLLGISPPSICAVPTFRNHVSFHLQRLEVDSLPPAFEDGTDTWFRNVGTAHIDAGEVPKRTVAIFKSRRKLEMYGIKMLFVTILLLSLHCVLFRLNSVSYLWMLRCKFFSRREINFVSVSSSGYLALGRPINTTTTPK
jgi:hypothetical protein